MSLDAIEQTFLNGLAWGLGFALPFFFGLTYSALAILNHKTARAIARAADRITKEGGGDLWTTLVKEGFAWLRSGREEAKK